MTVPAIKWEDNKLYLLDQRLLPEEIIYIEYTTAESVAKAITDMVVRGAPAIGVATGYAIALFIKESIERRSNLSASFEAVCKSLYQARPTAVNLKWALDRMGDLFSRVFSDNLSSENYSDDYIVNLFIKEAKYIHDQDIKMNHFIGKNGAGFLKNCKGVLTHCNAGALATGGFGTALGVIRQAYNEGANFHVYADETRPYLQGSRLTAFELMMDKIPVTVQPDSAAAVLMESGKIQAVIVGADRIAANGDVANKIGTYSLSILAHAHDIPFYVAAPTSTLDPYIPYGSEIPIEQRPEREVTHYNNIRLTPLGVNIFNPSFDITPSSKITAIITEVGVIYPPYTKMIEHAYNEGQKWMNSSHNFLK